MQWDYPCHPGAFFAHLNFFNMGLVFFVHCTYLRFTTTRTAKQSSPTWKRFRRAYLE
jgi:hypothetical protein